MTKSESIKELANGLGTFQSKMRAVKKQAENPFFKSKYADLASIVEAIKAPMIESGLSFSQIPTGNGGLTTIIMHESGEWIEDTFYMKPVQLPIKDKQGVITGLMEPTPQAVGSAITYMRRYALGAMLGIATEEDDDGNAASVEKVAQKRAKATDKPPFGPGSEIED